MIQARAEKAGSGTGDKRNGWRRSQRKRETKVETRSSARGTKRPSIRPGMEAIEDIGSVLPKLVKI